MNTRLSGCSGEHHGILRKLTILCKNKSQIQTFQISLGWHSMSDSDLMPNWPASKRHALLYITVLSLACASSLFEMSISMRFNAKRMLLCETLFKLHEPALHFYQLPTCNQTSQVFWPNKPASKPPTWMTLTLPRNTVLPPSFVVPSSMICDLPLCLLECMQVKKSKRNPAAQSRTHCTSLSQANYRGIQPMQACLWSVQSPAEL